ncbi:MAG: protein kinase [Rubripirellula sp.]
MAKKDPQNPNSLPDPDSNLNQEPVDESSRPNQSIEETVQFSNDDSAPNFEEEVPGPDDDSNRTVLESTIASISDSDELPSAESTVIPAQGESDPHGTLVPDGDAPSTDDLEATVQLASTVNIEPQVDPGSKTVTDEIDQTIAIKAPSSNSQTVVSRGGSPNESTIVTGGSIMASGEIDKTVNPRDLSKDDASLWASAVGEAANDPSVLPPAIDRTFSDKQFEKLRGCNVAPLQSDPTKSSDYRLVRKLGQGGMGDVFVARQGSLDRLLALKLIKPLSGKKREQLLKNGKLAAVEEERRQQFLSEAIVTGDLEHPNIVPVHDVALTSDNEIFYAMKRVIGTPWSDVIQEKTRSQNVDILLKVADAVGFAHTRGVVHRDIKPENVMLGDFGVVMVMDWGLALPTSDYEKLDSIYATSGLGGTPAFMAPEMATGPLKKIGPASDIYLLGATLYMIITGKAPHQAKNITECLKAVRTNAIREVSDAHRGELLNIALKAMASDPAKRYADVAGFQTAIREYRSHAESISLAVRAQNDLASGIADRSYADLSRAAFRFEESIKSWDQNERAILGLNETKIAHAEAAYENGDYDLGLSLLDDSVVEHQPILQKLRDGIQAREIKDSRFALLKKATAAMLVFILLGGSVAIGVIEWKRREAIEARVAATRAETAAVQSKDDALAAQKAEASERRKAEKAADEERKAKENLSIALEGEKEAKAELVVALKNVNEAKQVAENLALSEAKLKQEAVKLAKSEAKAAQEARDAEALARREKTRAEYEEYVSKIGLAKARLERNESEGARQILEDLRGNAPESADTFEWRWLWRQANQSKSATEAGDSIIDMSLSAKGDSGLVALRNGTVRRITLNANGELTGSTAISHPLLALIHATSVSVSEAGEAIGTASGSIFALTTGRRLRGHTGQINDLQFTEDGVLVSASNDKTVRLWDIHTGHELTRREACWHISPVRQIAVHGKTDSLTIATVIADETVGRVALWKVNRATDGVAVERVGTFGRHQHPVSSIAISSDGRLAASGDVAGNVLMWNPAAVSTIDYGRSIRNALDKVEAKAGVRDLAPANVRFARLIDNSPAAERRLVSTAPSQNRAKVAHDDVVKSIQFSSNDQSLLTTSDDYTLKVWDVDTRRLDKTLKGHGGWVVGAEFLPGQSDVIVSASNDSTVRTWRPGQYVGAYVMRKLVESDSARPDRRAEAHNKDIWSSSFSPDGNRIVTASRDHTARILEIDKDSLEFKEVSRLDSELLDEGTSFVALSMQVDRPHQRLYIGSADSTIRVWDLRQGTEIARASRSGLNTAFAVSRDGGWMLTGSSSPKIKAMLWKLDPSGSTSPTVVHRLKGHDQEVTSYAISPDSRYLFTGDRHGYGILWNAKTGEPLGDPIENVRGFRINAAKFSLDGRELLLAADDEQLTRVDLQSRRTTARLNHGGFVTQFALSSDGKHAISVSELTSASSVHSTAKLWNLRSGQGIVLDQLTNSRQAKSSSRDRKRIASVEFDSTGKRAIVSQTATSTSPATLRLWNVDSVQFPATERLVGTATGGDTSANARPEPQQVLEMPKVLGTTAKLLPIGDGKLMTMNKTAAFQWDLHTTKLTKSYRSHAEVTEACFSYDGKFVATASRSVKIWDPNSGTALEKLETPHVGPVRTVQFAPHAIGPERYAFVTGGDDGVARLWSWNAKTRQTKQLRKYVVKGRVQPIRRIRFSPAENDHRILVVGDNGSARIWNLADQRAPTKVLDMNNAGDFLSGGFSADGKSVAVGSSDHVLRVWESLDEVNPILLKGHADMINDLTLLGEQKGLRVMTASSDDTARIWDPRIGARDANEGHPGGREVVSLRRHTGDVTSVDVTKNGQLMMTAGHDGAVILWPAEAPLEKPNLFDELNQ